MAFRTLILSSVLLLVALVAASRGEELTTQRRAALLQASTVTVRVTLSPQDLADAAKLAAAGEQEANVVAAAASDPASRVTVCSGISLGDGLIVTSVFAGSDSRLRITLPGGEQAAAKVRVVDGYSGLILLQTDAKIPGLPVNDKPPVVGASIMSAAAWGVQRPVVSLGIVSGLERTVSGSTYPPLIQCDLRTTATSSGAGILADDGKLSGIIVLTGQSEQQQGWTFAVPASHVARLVRIWKQKQSQSASLDDNNRLVVLKRRRPVVGMVLGADQEQVLVRRVTEKSPAARAGIRVGDQILAMDEVKIRSVYQAVRPILFKQPGDTIRYEVKQGETTRTVQVQLGGGVELPSAPFKNLAQYVRPKVEVEGLARGGFRTRDSRGEIREVFAGDDDPDLRNPDSSTAAKIQLLERALDSYRHVIAYQQRELGIRDQEREKLETQVEQLVKEIKQLKRAKDAK